MNYGFTLNIESIDEASFSAKIVGGSADLLLVTKSTQTNMVAGTQYGPYAEYFPTKYPNDKTTYPGGQVSVMLMGQQCGPPSHNYQTVLFLDSDDVSGNVTEAWAFNVSMTPANPRSGSRAQFATYTAAYGSTTTTPNVSEIMNLAIGKGAQIKIVKKGTINTWTFDNGQCFQINFNVKSN